jgi:uncharacterized SAM-binding protein YcdF (DUF218 family)
MRIFRRRRADLFLPVYLAALLFILVGGHLLSSFPYRPEDIVYARDPVNADIIVFLEGEHYIRIDHALHLAEQGFAGTVFCPGLLLSRNIAYLQERLAGDKVDVKYYEGGGASSTYGEAIATRRFLKNFPVDSLLLVTSPYHSYRAWWTFQTVLGDVEVIPVPVPFEKNWFKLEDVVAGSFSYKVFRREQRKYAVSFLLYGWRGCFKSVSRS